MHVGTVDKMGMRRFSFHFVRIVLFILGAVLVFKAIWIISSLNSSPGLHLSENNKIPSKPKDDAVLVEVYYESMCPDSKYFITKELVPAFAKIPHEIDFKLKPYGKAKTYENSTGIYFKCQHRELECEGNKIHACAIKYIPNREDLLLYISCMITNLENPPGAAKSCAKHRNVDWNAIEKCAKEKEGSELLKMYGEETHALNPAVSFIPTILLNKDQGEQPSILKDFLKEVCLRYPGEKPAACNRGRER